LESEINIKTIGEGGPRIMPQDLVKKNDRLFFQMFQILASQAIKKDTE